MNFNDEPVYVGRDFGGREITVDDALVAAYRAAVLDDNPLYDSYCPALLLHSECYQNLNWYLKNIFGNLHARQEWELYAAVPVGTAVTTRGFIRERYRKRGRDYLVKETWVLDKGGRLLNRGITHQSFLAAGPDAAGAGPRAVERENVVVNKDREKDTSRRFDLETTDGVELESVSKHVSEEMCMAFSGPGENYHTNREAAVALGFPDIVVQGMMPICFISEVLTRKFAQGWLTAGKMDVRLVNPLWGGERVSAHAQIIDESPESDRSRVSLQVWVQKDDGTKVIVGSASALR